MDRIQVFPNLLYGVGMLVCCGKEISRMSDLFRAREAIISPVRLMMALMPLLAERTMVIPSSTARSWVVTKC